MLFSATGCVVRHENTRRWTVGCYNGLKVSCFGDFEKFFCISIYCVSALSLHIESTDSMMMLWFNRYHPTHHTTSCTTVLTSCAVGVSVLDTVCRVVGSLRSRGMMGFHVLSKYMQTHTKHISSEYNEWHVVPAKYCYCIGKVLR